MKQVNKAIETDSAEKANELLSNGWILLCIAPRQQTGPVLSYMKKGFSFSLGFPIVLNKVGNKKTQADIIEERRDKLFAELLELKIYCSCPLCKKAMESHSKEQTVNITDKISPRIDEMTENNKKIIELLSRNAELTLELINGVNDVQKLSEHCQDCKEEFGHPVNCIGCHHKKE